MQKTFKICHIDNEKIKKSFIFKGDLTREERKEGKEENINEWIHEDDSIQRIKEKIILNCKLNISIPELYLFGVSNKKSNPEIIYNNLTQNDNFELTKEILCNYHLNFKKSRLI